MCKMLLFVSVCPFVLAYVSAASQNQGDACVDHNNSTGVCWNISQCRTDQPGLKLEVTHIICGYNDTDPYVCCPPDMVERTKKDNLTVISRIKRNGCRPLTPSPPNLKIGKIAFEKCVAYQESILFPCDFLGRRQRLCPNQRVTVVVVSGGTPASNGDFAHMALLGYGENNTEWSCGGSVISERYILTAGHCVRHPRLGPVTWVRLGILKRSDELKIGQLYRVQRVIPHPDFHPPNKYNDIALLLTDRTINFNPNAVVPACLNVDDGIEDKMTDASATGWGSLSSTGELADTLQKVKITKFSTEECFEFYGPDRNLEQGFDEITQLCYGHRKFSRDTCRGDSGGPLQLNNLVHCMFTVIGVTSFGRSCGTAGRPGVYTRVYPYVPWIERQVWGPQEDEESVRDEAV